MSSRPSLSTGARAADRALASGWALAGITGTIFLLAHVVNHVALDDRIGELQASAEQNIWSWAASMATLVAGLSTLIYARSARRTRRAWALGALLVFFALDDYVEIHENLGDDVSDALSLPDYVGPRLWVVLYLPLLGAAAALLWSLAEELGGRARSGILAGAALLAAGYLLEGLGILTKRLEDRGVELPHALRAGLEESAELAGLIVLASALTAGMLGTPPERREEDDVADRVLPGQHHRKSVDSEA